MAHIEVTVGDADLGGDDNTYHMLLSDGEEIGYYYPHNRTVVVFARPALQSAIEKTLRAKFRRTQYAIEDTEDINFEFD